MVLLCGCSVVSGCVVDVLCGGCVVLCGVVRGAVVFLWCCVVVSGVLWLL